MQLEHVSPEIILIIYTLKISKRQPHQKRNEKRSCYCLFYTTYFLLLHVN